MTCDKAAQFISALFDGELIPREAALHLDRCPACRQRLSDYSRMSAELRRLASAMPGDLLPNLSLEQNARPPRSFWNLGRQSMRIPRIAFALMLVAIAVLSTGLVLVRARDNQPWWFEMNVHFPPQGAVISSILSASNFKSKSPQLDFVQPLAHSQLAWSVRLIDSRDGAEQIGIRARELPLSLDQSSAIEQAHAAPEQVNWFVSGKPLHLQVPRSESGLEITAETFRESPWHYNLQQKPPLVKEGFLRLTFPELLCDGKLIAGGSRSGAETSGDGIIALYSPGQGAFLFSRERFEGATPAKVEENHVTFSVNGRSYLLLTESPTTDLNGAPKGSIWVRHLPKFRFRTSDGKNVGAVFTIPRAQLPYLDKP